MNILGLNYGGHDTSASITVKGNVVAACEEERYDYVKHSRNSPINAINDCLKIAKLKIKDIDLISFSNDPYLQIREKYIKLAIEDNNRVDFLINELDSPDVVLVEGYKNDIHPKIEIIKDSLDSSTFMFKNLKNITALISDIEISSFKKKQFKKNQIDEIVEHILNYK